jgi:hypothetical protein
MFLDRDEIQDCPCIFADFRLGVIATHCCLWNSVKVVAKTSLSTKAIKRNANRFPDDFVFRLTPKEKTILRSQSDILNGDNRSQSVTGSQKHRDPRYLPYVVLRC